MTDPLPRPEPVKQAAALGGLVSAAVAAVGGVVTLVAAHAELSTVATAVGGAVTAVVTLVAFCAPYLSALRARKLVTPLEAPQNAYGTTLVEAPWGRHEAPDVTGQEPHEAN